MSYVTQKIDLLFRINKSKKQKDLAKKIGISTSTLSTWLSKSRDIPPEHLIPICEFFGISLEWLLTESNDEIPQIPTEKDWLDLFNQLTEHEKIECYRFIKGYINYSHPQ